MKQLGLYMLRWQLSGVILAPCLFVFKIYGITTSTIIANLIGSLIFFKIDKYIMLYSELKKE